MDALPVDSVPDPKLLVNISPKRGPIDQTYAAGLKGQKIALYAPSLGAARQLAVEHFKPKKRDLPLLWVIHIGY